MANLKITVPDMGDFKDVEVIEVLVKEGQTINKNDSIITLESDKSSVEVPSTHSGKIGKINVSVGDKINKNDLILTLETSEKKEEIKKEKPKESKVAGVLRLIPMSIQIEYVRVLEKDPLEKAIVI